MKFEKGYDQEHAQLKAYSSVIFSVINLGMISVNLVAYILLLELMILAAIDELYLFVGLYIFHITFTTYDFLYTIGCLGSGILHALFGFFSQIINLYTLMVFSLLLYWGLTVEKDQTVIIATYGFCGVFFGLPSIEAFIFRVLAQSSPRRQKHQQVIKVPESNYVIIPQNRIQYGLNNNQMV